MLILFFTFFLLSGPVADEFEWGSLPEVISTVGVDARYPKIQIDSSGNVVAVWVEDGLVKGKTKLFNESWGDLVTISNSAATGLRLGMDGSGNAIAVWKEAGGIAAALKVFNQNWSLPTILSDSNTSFPEVALDTYGNAVAVWVRNGNIETSTKLVNQSWSVPPSVIESSSAQSPQVDIGADGTVIVVWQGSDQSKSIIYSAEKPIAGFWGVQERISSLEKNSSHPRVSVDVNGKAVVIWFQFELLGYQYSNVILQSVSKTVGGDWTLPVDISEPSIYSPSDLTSRIEHDFYGNAIAVWTNSFSGSDFNIQTSVKPVNKDWVFPSSLEAQNFHACSVDCSVLPNGLVMVLYSSFNKGTDSLNVHAVHGSLNAYRVNLWSIPGVISDVNSASQVRVSTALNGDIIYGYAIWSSFVGGNIQIETLSGMGTNILPPSNFVAAQAMSDYGLFKEYHNTLSWGPSASTNIKGYVIFRNGILIQEVSGTVFQYVDFNQHQNEPVVYGIAAFDYEYCQSATLTCSPF